VRKRQGGKPVAHSESKVALAIETRWEDPLTGGLAPSADRDFFEILVPCLVEGRSELRNVGRVNCKTLTHFLGCGTPYLLNE
jgi:hypothetical protein